MLIIMGIIVPLVVGGVLAWLARKYDWKNSYGESARITGVEFGVVCALIVGIAVLVIVVIGPNLARDGAINGYHEFYNGSVTETRIDVDTCDRDGSCDRYYDCDPYEVKVTDRAAYTDSNGTHHSESYHYETRYHHCPYVTKELDYVVDTNIGQTHVIGDDYFEEHPEEWRSGRGIPGDVPRQPPERWLKAKADLENGMSDPVTGVFTYANFVLASDSDLYKKYDGSIESFQKAKLLPEHTAKLGDDDMLFDYDMQAMKVQAVGGLKLSNIGEWQNRLMRFNAALGSDLQGDLHIVLVPASKVSNPDEYITALKAYWTSLGKWSISKNGIILAIGASPDGKTVEWSRATTGMPIGNGEMVTALALKLKSNPFDPDTLLGDVSTTIRKDGDDLKVTYDHSSAGLIGRVVFDEFPFKRACMECKDAGDKGAGYVSLKELVPITTGAKILMFIIVLVLSLVLWGLALAFDPIGAFTNPERRKKSNQYY